MIGKTIAERYRITGELGKGGMGVVYQAEHVGTGRKLAVKVITKELSAHREMVLRFEREARAAGSIETPHIVQVVDAGTDPVTGDVFMAMELLRGEDLAQLMKRLGPLPPTLAFRLTAQACLGLARAHEANVVHRDIKPANIFLSHGESGQVIVKVVDFGIAKIMGEPGSAGGAEHGSLTQTGGVLGSPLYMSPEQAMGKKNVDHRTDMWSMGVLLYQALTGEVPRTGEGFGEILLAICSLDGTPLQTYAPWVGPEMVAVVDRAMARKADDRFSTMMEMKEALERLAGGTIAVSVHDLVRLNDAERTIVAPLYSVGPTAASPSFAPAGFGGASAAVPQGGFASMAPPPRGGIVEQAVTGGPASRSVALPPEWAKKKSRVALFGAAVSIIGVVGGVGAAVVLRKGEGPPRPSSAVSPPPVSPAVTASALPSVVLPPVEESVIPEEPTVRVAVEPDGVKVEVDGKPVTVTNGMFQLRGAVGSAHRVRLLKDDQETLAQFAITAEGAVPAKLHAETAKGRPNGSKSPTQAKKPGDQALDGKFE